MRHLRDKIIELCHYIHHHDMKVSREQSRQDKTQLKEEVEELRGLLDARDGEIKVSDDDVDGKKTKDFRQIFLAIIILFTIIIIKMFVRSW